MNSRILFFILLLSAANLSVVAAVAPKNTPAPEKPKEWLENLEQGKKQAEQTNKWLLVFFYQGDSALGQNMLDKVFPAPESREALESFIKVKIPSNGIGSPGYRQASELQIRRFPCTVFFDSKGNELDRFSGYLDSTMLLQHAAEAVDPKTNYVVLRDRLKKDPHDVQALYGMGCKHLRRGEFDKAKTYFGQVAQLDPKDEHRFADNLTLRQAEQLLQESQSAKALQLIEEFQKKYPDSDELDTAAYLRARLLWLSGRKTESLPAYEQFLKEFPLSVYRQQARDALRALQEPASAPTSRIVL